MTSSKPLNAEVVVFCTLAAIGALLLSVVLVAKVDYFYPFMFFVALSSVAYNRYAADSDEDEDLQQVEITRRIELPR